MFGSACKRSETFAAASVAGALFAFYFGYEILRSANSTMFNEVCGTQHLSLAAALAVPASLLATLGASYLIERLGTSMTLCCVAVLTVTVFSVVALSSVALREQCEVVVVSYIVREVYVCLIGSHIWAHFNTWLNVRATARMLGPVEGIAAIGGTLGGLAVAHLRVGETLHPSAVCAWAAAISLSVVLALVHNAAGVLGQPSRTSSTGSAGSGMGTRSGGGGSSLRQQLVALGKSRVLCAIFAMVLCMQIASGNLVIALQTMLSTRYTDRAAMMRTNGLVNAANNFGAALAQFTATPFLLQRYAPGTIHVGLATANLAMCVIAYLLPSVATAAAAYVLFKSSGYSIAASAFEMVYARLGFDERFHGKAFIQSVAYRAGKGATFFIMPLVTSTFALQPLQLHQMLAVLAATGWLTMSGALHLAQRDTATKLHRN